MREYAEDDDALTAALDVGASAEGPFTLPRSSLPPPMLGQALTDDFNEPLMQQPALTVPQLTGARQQISARDFDLPSGDLNERQRPRVTEHLRAIGRLPPRHAMLPAVVLRSIDAMYALLPSAADDIQRKSVIRQAFANENHLRMALLGLIELMDSSVDTSDPVIQDAKIEALIKILLFEEQRRKETGRFPSGPVSSSRGLAPSSAPPPAGLPPPSAPPGSFGQRTSPGFYYPPPFAGETAPASYPPGSGISPPHIATRSSAPMLGTQSYPPPPPLPNLPADPASSRRRTVPPPLPPSYPRG
jgi:hypothetical protein